MAFGGVHFGPSSGPLVYSDVHCGGWEKNIEECMKKSHLEIECSHRAVAGVMCSDGMLCVIAFETSLQLTPQLMFSPPLNYPVHFFQIV